MEHTTTQQSTSTFEDAVLIEATLIQEFPDRGERDLARSYVLELFRASARGEGLPTSENIAQALNDRLKAI